MALKEAKARARSKSYSEGFSNFTRHYAPAKKDDLRQAAQGKKKAPRGLRSDGVAPFLYISLSRGQRQDDTRDDLITRQDDINSLMAEEVERLSSVRQQQPRSKKPGASL